MTYLKTLQYLQSFINYENITSFSYKQSFKLERIRNFLTSIGNPQAHLRCIHIAGTKGKGSTCVFIAYILREAGYKVGLYTSPHLSDFRERIRILQIPPLPSPLPNQDFAGMISQRELADLAERLRPAIERYHKNSPYGPLSFFEVYTSLAFVYFKEKKVDFAVLETGLGGRLDATNVVNPLVVGITSISYEHTQKLGKTLKEVAKEKAGIIKAKSAKSKEQGLVVISAPQKQARLIKEQSAKSKEQGLVVISAPQKKEVIRVIRERAKALGSELYEVGKDIAYQKTKDGFKIKGIFGKYTGLNIKLLGAHQLINASVAIGIIEGLRFYNINIDIDSIRMGLYNTCWPGRCEVISKKPLVILDGAQNIASSRAIKETIINNFKYQQLILVLGISQDKDIRGICNELSKISDRVVLTRADNPRATKPEILANFFNGKEVHITDNVREARIRAFNLAHKEDLVLVCGSLFLVGEFRDDKVRSQ